MHCVQSKPLTQPNLSKQITQSKQVKAHNLNVQLNIKQPTWHLGEKPIRDWPIAALKGFHQGHAAPRTHHQNMQIQPGSRYLLASKVLIIKPFVHTREKKSLIFSSHQSTVAVGQHFKLYGFCATMWNFKRDFFSGWAASSHRDAARWLNETHVSLSNLRGRRGRYTLILAKINSQLSVLHPWCTHATITHSI